MNLKATNEQKNFLAHVGSLIIIFLISERKSWHDLANEIVMQTDERMNLKVSPAIKMKRNPLELFIEMNRSILYKLWPEDGY